MARNLRQQPLRTAQMTYHWTVAYLTPGGQAVQLWDRKVNAFWKLTSRSSTREASLEMVSERSARCATEESHETP